MADAGAALGPLSKLVDGASDYYEFWKDYKGEEVLIRSKSVNMGGPDDTGKISQRTHIIRGTVSDVTSFPPGFLLEDVEEYVELSDLSLLFGMGSTEPQDVAEGIQGKQTLRKVDEKYVSFNAIEELEPAEAADSAIEPFRDSK